VTVWLRNAVDSQVATTGVVPEGTPLRKIVSVTGLPVCGSPIDSAWLNSNCTDRFVGPDDEAACGDDSECAGGMRPGQETAAQQTPANKITFRWRRDFIAASYRSR
jgi:hypothetical protein